MKILKVLLYTILALGAMFAGFGLFAKKQYHIERSIEIDAPKEMVYEYVRHFKNFNEWSPWTSFDPNMQSAVTGQDGEVGATYTWSGNKRVGSGTQKIVAIAPDHIDLALQYTDIPDRVTPVSFRFEPIERRTKVHWIMEMHIPFPWNGLAMFTDVPRAIGKDFVRGLENLERICETAAFEKYRGLEAQEMDVPAQQYFGIRQMVDSGSVAVFYAESMILLREALAKQEMTASGEPALLCWDSKDSLVDVAAVIPVTDAKKVGKPFGIFTAGGGKSMVIEYFGDYSRLMDAHIAMQSFMDEKGVVCVPPVVERYMTDPTTEPDTAKWLTKVIYTVTAKPK
jgi:effector-binding domain-containing protein